MTLKLKNDQRKIMKFSSHFSRTVIRLNRMSFVVTHNFYIFLREKKKLAFVKMIVSVINDHDDHNNFVLFLEVYAEQVKKGCFDHRMGHSNLNQSCKECG